MTVRGAVPAGVASRTAASWISLVPLAPTGRRHLAPRGRDRIRRGRLAKHSGRSQAVRRSRFARARRRIGLDAFGTVAGSLPGSLGTRGQPRASCPRLPTGQNASATSDEHNTDPCRHIFVPPGRVQHQRRCPPYCLVYAPAKPRPTKLLLATRSDFFRGLRHPPSRLRDLWPSGRQTCGVYDSFLDLL
jgi:hypothetical protein